MSATVYFSFLPSGKVEKLPQYIDSAGLVSRLIVCIIK
nr:MAG TPA: hypothetical protein [Caudoviricetes sp.]